MSGDKLISADALKQAVWQRFEQTQTVEAFLRLIDDSPPVEGVEKMVEGTWLYTEAEGGLKYWLCSNCRDSYHKKNPHDMKRCYRCGAYMKMQG